jgi:Protein of unknown function (DUF1329)
MKRRTFSFLTGTMLAALKLGRAGAQSANNQSLLTTTLTPMGSQRAGNADGSIPAWNGGYTTIPSGWQPGDYMPDFFVEEQPSLVVDASNVQQHSERLSDGTIALINKYGFSLKIYPTHRTASAPQWVYDNIAKNADRAELNPAGGRFGFRNAYGGVPFPLPDVSDSLSAGAQIIWNHNARWCGQAVSVTDNSYVVNNGSVVLASINEDKFVYPYYSSSGSLENFDGLQFKGSAFVAGPANLVGTQALTYQQTDGPTIAWEVLSGQGRVRKAPEVAYDTPSSYTDGISNYDEYFGFTGSLDRYDWKYLGKKELYIPYNNNGLYLLPAEQVHKAHFFDPNVVRWELHRVWVVEATLHPGQRNILARRRFYVDEDTWTIALVDAWDAAGNLYKVNTCYNFLRPDLPGLVFGQNVVNNMQTDDYVSVGGPWNQRAQPTYNFYDSLPATEFDAEHMAAAAQY